MADPASTPASGGFFGWLTGAAQTVEADAIAIRNKLPSLADLSKLTAPALNIAQALGTKIPLSQDLKLLQAKINDLTSQGNILKAAAAARSAAIKAQSDGGASINGQITSALSNADTAITQLKAVITQAQQLQANAAKFNIASSDASSYTSAKTVALQLGNVALNAMRNLVVTINAAAGTLAANATTPSRPITGGINAFESGSGGGGSGTGLVGSVVSDMSTVGTKVSGAANTAESFIAKAAPWFIVGGLGLFAWNMLKPGAGKKRR